MEECPDVERKNLVNLDDSESDEGCKDIADLLPNDPFGLELNIGLPSDPFGMGFEVSLPRDPFGMEFNVEATVAAITGWIEEFGLKAYEFETDEASEDKNNDDSKIFAELNFVWTSFMKYEQEVGENEMVDAGLGAHMEDGSNDDCNTLGGDIEDLMCFGCEKYENVQAKDCNDADGGAPADALFFALGYLGVEDLLSIEDYPLSGKITDDDLIRITNRARGTLCRLSLVKCLKITNTGLKHVLESNPGLTKLSVAGCIKLSIEGILHDVKAFNSVALPGIKHLRIGELFGLTNQHFEEFKFLLGADEDKKSSIYKPRFYRADQLYLSLDDERAIDIETCPRCEQARQVYDCPAESCQEKIHSAKACRGCIFCISRCINCGCCLDNKAYEETFCLDLLCLDCLGQLLDCQDNVTFHHFFLYG
ncbi:hypothetical protein DH2020_009508 [Rehmannia glutinosa]|uniref:F-box protein n=1 Tax=Rehmannia glutinosa TaxID=99300 RepID=A0ABR0X9G5_REHGL